MLNLRTIFAKYRIFFRDRGANCSNGNIVIQCPYCANSDRGQHLAVNEGTGQYFCFRNPRHAGNNVGFLLKKLQVPHYEYEGLVLTEIQKIITEDTRDYTEFKYFDTAEENREALDYLSSRLFSDPIGICKTFGLKISRQGKWLGRLIIPLTIGWTGRAMRLGMEPRYKAWTSEDGFFLHKQKSTSCIIVEGALDAMRIASVSSQFDVIGKCRIALSPAILAYLQQANYDSIYNSPDAKVPYSQYRMETATIKSYCTKAYVSRFMLPNNGKDFGATPENEARRLLLTLGMERMVSYGESTIA